MREQVTLIKSTRSDEATPGTDLLIVMSHMGNGGAQRVVANMLPLWIDKGVRITLILGNSGPRVQKAYDLPNEVEIIEHERWIPRWSVLKIAGMINVARSFLRLRREIRRLRPTTVLSLICPANIKTILACVGLGVPRLVVSERNNPARQEFPAHVRLGRWLLYRHADVVTANSEGACAWLARIAPRSTIEYLPNPVEIPSSVTSRRHAGDPVRLLYVGRLVEQKRVYELTRLLAEPALSDCDVVLTVVGSGPERDALQRLAARLEVENRIEFAGQVTDVSRFYERADLFVLLSRYEGMPNALLEAMAWKVAPVVSAEVNESTRLIEHGENGMVVDGRDTVAVADVIRELVRAPALRERVAERARITALDYSHDRVFREWNRILRIDEGAHGRGADTAQSVET